MAKSRELRAVPAAVAAGPADRMRPRKYTRINVDTSTTRT